MNIKTAIVLFILLFLSGLLFIIRLRSQDQVKPPTTIPPTSTPTAQPTITPGDQQILHILSTDPGDDEQNVPINIPIRVFLSQDADPDTLTVRIVPTLNFTKSVINQTLFLQHSDHFAAQTTYTITIQATSLQSPYVFSFTSGSDLAQGTAPDAESLREQELFLQENYPDVFLGSKVPYSTDQFYIYTGGYKEPPVDHYYFIVTLKGDETAARDAVMDWLQSLGLTDAQIQRLDIEYHTE